MTQPIFDGRYRSACAPPARHSGIGAWSQLLERRFLALVALICIPPWSDAAVRAETVPPGAAGPSLASAAHVVEPMAELDAWHAAQLMGVGVNIGNTLDNTSK